LTALLHHPAAPRGESVTALKKYLAYGYIPGPLSAIEGIRKLPGGCCGTLDIATGSWEERRWWEFRLEPSAESVTPARVALWSEELLALLDGAVRRRLVADVPVGVFLSGGIDSSAVAALAARHLPKGRLRTFSVGFTDPTFDELPFAREAAAFIGCAHDSEILDLARARDLLPGLLARLDEPMGDGSILPTCCCAALPAATSPSRWAVTGETNSSPDTIPSSALGKASLYDHLVPRALHPAIRLLASRLPVSHANVSLDFKIKRTLRGLSHPAAHRVPVWMGPLEPAQIDADFGDRTPPEELYSEAIAAWEACGEHADPVDRTLQFFTRLYLQDQILTKVDRASMLHGLEARSPFLDLEVVDFARRLPHAVKLRGGVTKWILKKALEPLLPASILHRKKKGFGTPLGAWLRDGVIAPGIPVGSAGQIVAKALSDHRSGKSDERLFLWCQHVLDSWRAALPPAA